VIGRKIFDKFGFIGSRRRGRERRREGGRGRERRREGRREREKKGRREKVRRVKRLVVGNVNILSALLSIPSEEVWLQWRTKLKAPNTELKLVLRNPFR
jgi:hypothetical protein